MKFQIFSEKIEFSKLNLKIKFHEPLKGSWKVIGCNTARSILSVLVCFELLHYSNNIVNTMHQIQNMKRFS